MVVTAAAACFRGHKRNSRGERDKLFGTSAVILPHIIVWHFIVCRQKYGKGCPIAFVRKTSPRIVFGKRLRELRLERRISQEKLAEIAHLHRNYIGVLERGGQSPSLDAICKLASALKVSAAELVANLP